MKIKEVSKIVKVSRRTLQYYDDIGLVKAKRLENNHREYDDRQLDVLWKILFLKEIGLSLDDIKKIISGEEIDLYLKNRLLSIDRLVDELEERKKLLSLILKNGVPSKPDKLSKDYLSYIKNYKI